MGLMYSNRNLFDSERAVGILMLSENTIDPEVTPDSLTNSAHAFGTHFVPWKFKMPLCD